jgi:Uma2 family endonuclease
MSALPIAPKVTVEEYLALDRAAELKSEYHDGELYPIAGVSLKHGRLALRAGMAIESRIAERSCLTAVSPVRVRVSASKYIYPDLVVVCGDPFFTDEHVDTITNPKVIVEVLSPSTADYDSGGKFRLYRTLDSFQEYVLISQDEAEVQVYRKKSSEFWNIEIVTRLDAMVRLESIQVEFPLSEVYRGILEA